MRLDLPDPALVLLVGPTSSGKSSWAARHFGATEVVSSDRCRALVADDENDQTATDAAFAVLQLIVASRLERARLTVVDATNVQPHARAALVALARRHHLPVAAVVFDLPLPLLEARLAARTDRDAPVEALHRQREQLHRSLEALVDGTEGIAPVHRLDAPDQVDGAEVTRRPLACDRRDLPGPFDVVGDVHGCHGELVALLERLGYVRDPAPTDAAIDPADLPWRHPAGRRVVFVGDLVDRGPGIVATLRLAMAMVAAGTALCVPGNHDDKLVRALDGRPVHVSHGLERSLAELGTAPPALAARVRAFLAGLPSHLVLAGGALVVAHAGLPQALHGRESRRVRDHALFGETTGVLDPDGLPVRIDWAARYRGTALVVYGHTPVTAPRWRHETVDVDTGCVFGGALTALRWPERELVQVPACARYAEPGRPMSADPFLHPSLATRPTRVGSADRRDAERRDAERRDAERRRGAVSRSGGTRGWPTTAPGAAPPPGAPAPPGPARDGPPG